MSHEFWRVMNSVGLPLPPLTLRERATRWWRRGEDTRLALGFAISVTLAMYGFGAFR